MRSFAPVAIIGAGISGLSCAQTLLQAGIEVRLFERARRVGGRCATRLWQGHLVDHGVQFFTAKSTEFKQELLNRLRQFRPIVAPVIDHEGKPIPSRGGPRFYVLQGNNYLAQAISQGLDVRYNTNIDTVSFQSNGIVCEDRTYGAVVSSLPAPQTARLFSLPQSPAEYLCCLSAILEYPGENVGDSQDCYARTLPDGTEPLMISYCENHKSGRVIGNKTVFVAQAAPHFSLCYADTPAEEYVPFIIKAHEDLWKIPSGKCTASFGHRWRLSRPWEGSRVSVELPPGAFICGDSRTGPTVEEVWQDGRRAADQVLAYLRS